MSTFQNSNPTPWNPCGHCENIPVEFHCVISCVPSVKSHEMAELFPSKVKVRRARNGSLPFRVA